MPRRILCVVVFLASAGLVSAQPTPNITGAWVLNPALTQKPAEIGFNRDFPSGGGEEGGRGGGRGGRRGGGSGFGGARAGGNASQESADDSVRVDQLTAQARTPPTRITIVQQTNTVAIADDQGHTRTVHPDGHLEDLTLGTVALPTTSRWDAGSLVILYDVERGRQLRYTFTPATNPTRLLVDIRFLERGREGDEVKLTYETPDAHDRAILAGTAPIAPAAPAASAPPPAGAASSASLPSARPRVLPPGSELHGLTTIGTTVDELSASAAACGLDQAKIKSAAAGILAGAGFKTQPDHNEETYLLLSVVTSRLPDGVCVSRYDASLVSDADATFPYLNGLVQVQVPLLHTGGMAGGSPASHAAAVMDALTKAVNGFVAQIRR